MRTISRRIDRMMQSFSMFGLDPEQYEEIFNDEVYAISLKLQLEFVWKSGN
jgi:hypothetical protein